MRGRSIDGALLGAHIDGEALGFRKAVDRDWAISRSLRLFQQRCGLFAWPLTMPFLQRAGLSTL